MCKVQHAKNIIQYVIEHVIKFHLYVMNDLTLTHQRHVMTWLKLHGVYVNPSIGNLKKHNEPIY